MAPAPAMAAALSGTRADAIMRHVAPEALCSTAEDPSFMLGGGEIATGASSSIVTTPNLGMGSDNSLQACGPQMGGGISRPGDAPFSFGSETAKHGTAASSSSASVPMKEQCQPVAAKLSKS